MKRYFVQTIQHDQPAKVVWEEVDEWTFLHRSIVLVGMDDGRPRYGDQFVMTDGDNITFSGTISRDVLGIICRFLTVVIPQGNVDGGWLREPAMVFTKNVRGKVILHQMHGGNFVPEKKSAAA